MFSDRLRQEALAVLQTPRLRHREAGETGPEQTASQRVSWEPSHRALSTCSLTNTLSRDPNTLGKPALQCPSEEVWVCFQAQMGLTNISYFSAHCAGATLCLLPVLGTKPPCPAQGVLQAPHPLPSSAQRLLQAHNKRCEKAVMTKQRPFPFLPGCLPQVNLLSFSKGCSILNFKPALQV